MNITEFLNQAVGAWEQLDLTADEWDNALTAQQFQLYLAFRTLVETQKLTAPEQTTVEFVPEPAKAPRTRKKA